MTDVQSDPSIPTTNAAAAEAALAVESVSAGYGRTQVLRDVSLEVPAGSVVTLLGPNGAGKTTLIKVVAGLLPVTAGRIVMFGDDVERWSPEERSSRYLCTVPEGRGIYRSLTVKENLRLQSPRGKLAETLERATQAFRVLGERLEQQAGTLSGGEQQMLSLASAYVRDPKLVVIDEASLGLAPIIVDAVFGFIERLRREGASMLVVDQFVERALNIADRAYILNKGAVVFEGTAAELQQGNMFERYLGHS